MRNCVIRKKSKTLDERPEMNGCSFSLSHSGTVRDLRFSFCAILQAASYVLEKLHIMVQIVAGKRNYRSAQFDGYRLIDAKNVHLHGE